VAKTIFANRYKRSDKFEFSGKDSDSHLHGTLQAHLAQLSFALRAEPPPIFDQEGHDETRKANEYLDKWVPLDALKEPSAVFKESTSGSHM